MNAPLISVVIPTYNYGRFVCQAVDSALAQTYRPIEVIVVDDGSTDDTRKRLSGYGAPVRYVWQKNRGVSSALNKGISLATGDWIAFLGADDVWPAQALERQWQACQLHSDIRVLATDFIVFAEEPPRVQPHLAGPVPVKYVSLRNLIGGIRFSAGSGASIHRTCFDSVGQFDESLSRGEDLEMLFRLVCRFSAAIITEPLLYKRVHGASLSSRMDVMAANHRLFIEKVFSTLPLVRGKWYWKRLMESRMHREVALMHMQAGDSRQAMLNLWKSFWAWPLTSCHDKRFTRLRTAVRLLRDGLRLSGRRAIGTQPS